MSSSTQYPSFPLKKPNPSLAEIEGFLDLLAEAMLLVDVRSRRILLANTRFAELTGYTRIEMTNQELGPLFVDFDAAAFWKNYAGENPTWQLKLKKHNKTLEEIQGRINLLPGQKKWVLITLTPLAALQQIEVNRLSQESFWENLLALELTHQQLNLQTAIRTAVKAGAVLTGADNLAVYQADSQNLVLNRVATWGEKLPEQIAAQELNPNRAAHLWIPGKRALTSLQRAARAAKFAYLVTAPLGQANASIGLIAAGGEQPVQGDQILQIVKILAANLTTLIQHHTLVANLQHNLERQFRNIRICETAQEAIHDSLIVLAPDLHILRINHAAEVTLEYRSQEIRGQAVEKILIGPDTIGYALAAAQQGSPSYGQGETRLYRRSGQEFPAQVSALPVMIDQELKGIVVLIRDMSEREQNQVHAQQLEQRALLGEVTAVFAHEVRNPINNISTGLQLMAMNLAEQDPNQEIITRLQQDCNRLEELMKSVLSFSHPTEYDMAPVDIGVLIERLIERMRPKINRANVKSHLQIDPSTPAVRGNLRALEQVFSNLVGNALQAMEEKGGTLALKVQPVKAGGKRRNVEISVTDSGPGITKENQEHIFQPFFTTKTSGTGLGLAITKRIITAHKGNIRVNSFPGGTVFQVLLPEVKQPEITDPFLEDEAFTENR